MSKSHSRTSPVEAEIDLGGIPKKAAKNGTRVKIHGGELPDDDATTTIQSMDGVGGRVEGEAYESVGGPSKGEIIQPIRTDDGKLVGVPTKRIATSGTKSRSNFSTGFKSQDHYDRVFRKGKYARKGK